VAGTDTRRNFLTMPKSSKCASSDPQGFGDFTRELKRLSCEVHKSVVRGDSRVRIGLTLNTLQGLVTMLQDAILVTVDDAARAASDEYRDESDGDDLSRPGYL
jgi:hypothetical protein